MKTIKWVLEEGKDLPFTEAPYSADIYYACRASNIMVSSTMTCREVLNKIEERKGTSLILNMKLDDLVSNVDSRFNRIIGGWFAGLVFALCLAVISINCYTAYTSGKFLSWDEFFLPLTISGMIVWNRMKILNDGTAKAVSTIVGAISPNLHRRYKNAKDKENGHHQHEHDVRNDTVYHQEYVDTNVHEEHVHDPHRSR